MYMMYIYSRGSRQSAYPVLCWGMLRKIAWMRGWSVCSVYSFIWCMYEVDLTKFVGANASIFRQFARPAIERFQVVPMPLSCLTADLHASYVGVCKRFFNLRSLVCAYHVGRCCMLGYLGTEAPRDACQDWRSDLLALVWCVSWEGCSVLLMLRFLR